MSNYQGRKTDFTPSVYTRYFERTETPKPSNGHIYFNDNNEETSTNYQIRRDLIFKRLFPSKYADSNDDNNTNTESMKPNGLNSSTAESLGDFIPLLNNDNNSSTLKRKHSSPESDVILSSSDENEADLLIEEQELPSHTHESIVGHLHPRSTIENVRSILIRELYQRTSDPHTEWLKCKMEIGKEYINPKYYSDFQRRYRKDIQKNTIKKNKSSTIKNKTENGYHVFDLTTNDQTVTTTLSDNSMENIDIIDPSPIKELKNISSNSPIVSTNSSKPSKSPPEYIILDSDEDNSPDNMKSTYFIDRSSASSTAISQSTSISTEDYHKEDSKYAQLPSRNTSSTSSPTVIRPILSKHQRRKKTNSTDSTKPLVSAIDRIIDHMDQSDTLANPNIIEQQNLVIKKLKKRKKKKKKSLNIN